MEVGRKLEELGGNLRSQRVPLRVTRIQTLLELPVQLDQGGDAVEKETVLLCVDDVVGG